MGVTVRLIIEYCVGMTAGTERVSVASQKVDKNGKWKGRNGGRVRMMGRVMGSG